MGRGAHHWHHRGAAHGGRGKHAGPGGATWRTNVIKLFREAEVNSPDMEEMFMGLMRPHELHEPGVIKLSLHFGI